MGMASTNPRGGSMGLQGPPYAVLSPLVADPLAPPGDPNQVYSSPTILYSRLVEYKIAGLGKTGGAYRSTTGLQESECGPPGNALRIRLVNGQCQVSGQMSVVK